MPHGPIRLEQAGRVVVFGPGALAAAGDLLAPGFTLLTTPRAAGSAPDPVAGAAAVVDVPPGLVEDAAAALRGRVPGAQWVALGGGRVVDVAKSLAAADPDPARSLVAVPTTLSGAEMTGNHRHARGVPDTAPKARADAVVNDPALSASAPEPRLAASSANALGHAVTAVCTDPPGPAHDRALRAVVLLARGWAADAPDREALAEGAMWAGWAVDETGIGLHHAMAQTAVRVAGVGHAPANAALLPETLAMMRRRRPDRIAAAEEAAGTDLDALTRDLRARTRDRAMAALAHDPALLERAVATVLGRPEPARATPAPDADEVRAAYLAAAAAVSAGAPG